jgi:hypothetical protein
MIGIKKNMKQTCYILTLITALTIGVLSINSEITFAQEKIKLQKLMILV